MSSEFIHARLLNDGSKTAAQSATYPISGSKFKFLLEQGKRPGVLVGAPARELLTEGGDRHLMWIDIDTCIFPLVLEWVASPEFPFPRSACRLINSSTGHFHLYVSTDRPLQPDECFSMKEWLVEQMQGSASILARLVDRLYGPANAESIFIPGCQRNCPALPQHLMADRKTVFKLPHLKGSVFQEWTRRHNIKIS